MTHYIAYKGKVGVSLAAMNRDYLPLLMQNANNLEVTQGVLLRPPVTIEMEEEWFNRIAKKSDTDHVFAILLHEPPIDGVTQYRYIGHCGLHRISWPDGTAKTGSIILEKGLHGKGYGTEAKLLLLYHAFFVKGLRKVCSEVKAFNGNSWGHLLKAGYEQVGRRIRQHFHQGMYVDEILFDVFREDFEVIWLKYEQTSELPKLSSEQKERLLEDSQILS